jgi:hypothetical protein
VGGAFDVELPGTFELKQGKDVTFTSHDVTGLLTKGAPVTIGGVEFKVRAEKKTGSTGRPPIDHRPRGGNVQQGKIFLVTEHVGEPMAGVVGKPASRWVPAATTHSGGAIEKFVSKSLETGQTGGWDPTALGCMRVGSVGCLLDGSGVEISDRTFWARVEGGTLVGSNGGAGAGAGAGGGEKEGTVAADDLFGKAHVVSRIVRTRNKEMGHRFQSSMSLEDFDDAVKLYRVALSVFAAPQGLRDRFEEVLSEMPDHITTFEETKQPEATRIGIKSQGETKFDQIRGYLGRIQSPHPAEAAAERIPAGEVRTLQGELVDLVDMVEVRRGGKRRVAYTIF